MRAYLSFAGLLLLSGAGLAQNSPSPYPTMPGTVVGTPVPVGSTFTPVGTNPGTPIGYIGSNGQPINAGQRPAGQMINLNNLAAPLAAPLPPELAGSRPKGTLEKLFDRWKEMLGFSKPDLTTSGYFPGLSRRNRERHKQDWRRD